MLSLPFLAGLIVALRVRAWIEISSGFTLYFLFSVALRVRAWIEILVFKVFITTNHRRSPCESVD